MALGTREQPRNVRRSKGGTHRSAEVLARSLDPKDGEIERAETHVSTVLFQDGWAYKVKKPVRFEFIDLLTVEERERNCRRELTLNHRFAPDVYDSVIEIRAKSGRVVDHAVRMRRMPSDRRLSSLVMTDDPRVNDALRAVAKAVAVAHGYSRRSAEISAVAEPAALERLWLRSLDDARSMVPDVFDKFTFVAVALRARRFLEGRHDLLRRRIDDGLIVDGHGDLLADDIFCLDDGPRILDCLEFDDLLRYGDVLADVAFLTMDLERLGRPDLAARFLGWYGQFSGEHHPASLQHHYIAYRALVRAKIAGLRAVGGKSIDTMVAAQARVFLDIAARHLKDGEVTVAIVGGLPGSGKSTLSDHIGRALGWAVVRSDLVRKELVGAGVESRASDYGTGIYTPEVTEDTYDALFDRARTALRMGESVVVDASFVDARHRKRAAELALETKSAFVQLRCHAPAGVLASRLRQRGYDPSTGSDATVEVAARMAQRADPWPGSAAINTSKSPEESCRAALAVVASS